MRVGESFRVFTQNPGDALSGTLSFPAGRVEALTPGSPTLLQFGEFGFATYGALLAAAPDGVYQYTVDSGVAAPGVGTIGVSSVWSTFSNETPYLTNFSAIEGADVGSSVSFDWNTWTAPAPNGPYPNLLLHLLQCLRHHDKQPGVLWER